MKQSLALCALIIVAAVFIFVALELHEFGVPEFTQMDTYFNLNAQNETGTNNVVTSIVFDYRGYDTLGEATVLFSAVCGIAIIFWIKK